MSSEMVEGQQQLPALQLAPSNASHFHDASNEDVEKAFAEEEVCCVCPDGFDGVDVESCNINGGTVKRKRCGCLVHASCLCEVVKMEHHADGLGLQLQKYEDKMEQKHLQECEDEKVHHQLDEDADGIGLQLQEYEDKMEQKRLQECEDEMVHHQLDEDADCVGLQLQEYDDKMEQKRMQECEDEKVHD